MIDQCYRQEINPFTFPHIWNQHLRAFLCQTSDPDINGVGNVCINEIVFMCAAIVFTSAAFLKHK